MLVVPTLKINTALKLFGQRPVDCIFWCKFLCLPPFCVRNIKKFYNFSCFMPLSSYPFPKCFIKKRLVHSCMRPRHLSRWMPDVCCLFLIVVGHQCLFFFNSRWVLAHWANWVQVPRPRVATARVKLPQGMMARQT